MEVENQVFGQSTETDEKYSVKNNKKADTYHEDKEVDELNLDKEIDEFLTYVDELIKDVPEASEEEVKAGIDKILAKAYPESQEEATVVPIEKGRKTKRTVKKVLLIAAVVVLIGAIGLFAMGQKHNISIENGFVTFAEDTIQITFFGEEEELISVDTLLADLKEHGYEDIMFPEAFLFDTECRVSVPRYSVENGVEQVNFYVYHNEYEFYFGIGKDIGNQTYSFPELGDGDTLLINGISVHIIEYDSGDSSINYINDKYKIYITGTVPYYEMVGIVKTIK